MVLPWHPEWTRGDRDEGVTFHLFRYAPLASLNVFGYASALGRTRGCGRGAGRDAAGAGGRAGAPRARWRARSKRDDDARPLGGAGRRAGRGGGAGGVPLVVSLHGSDVFLAERHETGRPRRTMGFHRAELRDGLQRRSPPSARSRSAHPAIAPSRSRMASTRGGSRPDPAMRAQTAGGVASRAGRRGRVRGWADSCARKGFEYLIDAIGILASRRPRLRLVLAGGGDLGGELRERVDAARHRRIASSCRACWHRTASPTRWPRRTSRSCPSVRDEAGNVDGLPNVVLEALASATPLVATAAGGHRQRGKG